jgi:Zn-dependent protease with chaperone function
MCIARLALARLLFSSQPFISESLDKLAQTMAVNTTLKKDKSSRYYLAKGNPSGTTALFNGAIIFDKKYYQMLTPEEVLAVGAHEFNHLVKKHARKKLFRVIVLPLMILVIAGLLTSALGTALHLFENSGYFVMSGLVVVFLLVCFVGSFYLNAPWLRQLETECDLSAVQFGYGEAMVTALIKLRERFPKSKWDIKLTKFFPRTYQLLNKEYKTYDKLAL